MSCPRTFSGFPFTPCYKLSGRKANGCRQVGYIDWSCSKQLKRRLRCTCGADVKWPSVWSRSKSQNCESPPLCDTFHSLQRSGGNKMLIESLGVWHFGVKPVYVPFHCSWYYNQHARGSRHSATEVWQSTRGLASGAAARTEYWSHLIYRTWHVG